MNKVTIDFPRVIDTDQQRIAWHLIVEWCYNNGMREHIFKESTSLNGPERIAQWIQDLKDEIESQKQHINQLNTLLKEEITPSEHTN